MKINISINFEDQKHYFRTLDIPFEGRLIRDFYTRTTSRFLEVFDKLGVKVRFLKSGKMQILKWTIKFVAQGHEIGNHTYYHPFAVSSLPQAKQQEEIHNTREKIHQFLGVRAQCYRAPCYDISLPNLIFMFSRVPLRFLILNNSAGLLSEIDL